METELLKQLLTQAPLLVFFVWWTQKQNNRWDDNNKNWREYLRERNGKLEKALDKMTGAIDKFHERLDNNV